MSRAQSRLTRPASGAALVLCAAGCDPVLNVAGSFFPAWMVSMLLGVGLTVAARYLFSAAGLEPHLGPTTLVYTSLGLFLTVVAWLLLYRG
jgi:YtcA-like protein